MKRILATVMALTVVLTTAAALAAFKGSADVVQASPAKAVVEAKAGERVAFAIEVAIDDKWHIYAHGDTNFIGVDLKPSDTFPLEDLEAKYPKGHEGEFFGEPVWMISGTERIEASALVPAGMAKGEHPLEFGVTVQACDDKTCLAPVDLPVKLKLVVQ
jgi:thiol:disulfide interchange protein DsbD